MLRLLEQGRSTKQIAAELHLSPRQSGTTSAVSFRPSASTLDWKPSPRHGPRHATSRTWRERQAVPPPTLGSVPSLASPDRTRWVRSVSTEGEQAALLIRAKEDEQVRIRLPRRFRPRQAPAENPHRCAVPVLPAAPLATPGSARSRTPWPPAPRRLARFQARYTASSRRRRPREETRPTPKPAAIPAKPVRHHAR